MAKKQESRPATLDAAFPRPTLPEPPAKFVHEAMKAFPAAVANGGNFWSGPLVTSAREWQAAPHVMAHRIIDANAEISLAAAAWGVFRLAELGLLSPTQEKANDGTIFWRTTPALWDWWNAGCAIDEGTPTAWHGAGETPPDEFMKNGPLTGQRKQLASWIMQDDDPRNLDTKLSLRIYWGRREMRTQFSVWFKDQKRFAEANARRLAEEQRNTNEVR